MYYRQTRIVDESSCLQRFANRHLGRPLSRATLRAFSRSMLMAAVVPSVCVDNGLKTAPSRFVPVVQRFVVSVRSHVQEPHLDLRFMCWPLSQPGNQTYSCVFVLSITASAATRNRNTFPTFVRMLAKIYPILSHRRSYHDNQLRDLLSVPFVARLVRLSLVSLVIMSSSSMCRSTLIMVYTHRRT